MSRRLKEWALDSALFLVIAASVLWLAHGCPAQAQDATLEPNATSAETNSDCTTGNAHTRLSDNSDATLCDGGDGSGSESYTIRVDFPTPASAPSTVTDDQVFQCRFQKSSSGGGNPTARMDLYCNDTLVETGTTTHSITSTTPAEFSESVTFGGSCASDGSDVELHMDIARTGGSPSGRKSVDSIDCDWDVTYAPAAGARRVVFIN